MQSGDTRVVLDAAASLCTTLAGLTSGAKPSQTDAIGQYRQTLAFAVVDLYPALRDCPGLIPNEVEYQKITSKDPSSLY
jgi:hypothetical protein